MLEKQYRKFAESFAKKAGKIIKKNFTLGMNKTWKHDSSPVTETDLAINSLLIKEINKLFPSHGVLAEEESATTFEEEYIWVCDPVDGTVPFSHGIPLCTFSLALTHRGKSILGVVYDAFLDRLFVGELGKGAFLNGKKIKVSKANNLKGTLGNFECFNAAKYNTFKFAEHVAMGMKARTMKAGSFIYPSVLVAAGELSFTIFPGKTAHDAAAVKIIVEEAGGKVTDIFGNDQRYDREINGLLVSNGVLHNELIKLSKKFVTLNNYK